MLTVVLALIIGIGIISFLIYFCICKAKKYEAHIKINVVDFQENNYYDMVSLSFKETKMKKTWKIKQKSSTIGIHGFKSKSIINGKITLINPIFKEKKELVIKIYKNYINIINIKINNGENLFYNSEVIFYTKNPNQHINVGNLEYSMHDSLRRKRLLLYNFNEEDLIKIIIDNNNDKNLEDSSIKIIKNNGNNFLLINMYISEQKTNILIFVEEEQFLIRPSENEKKFFENFYRYIIENKDCESKLLDKCIEYKDIITKKGSLFGQVMPDFDESKNFNKDLDLIQRRNSFGNKIYKCRRKSRQAISLYRRRFARRFESQQ